MAIIFNDNILNRSPKALDAKVGVFQSGIWRPYNSISEAVNSIPVPERYIGLMIDITVDGVTIKYWFRNGITNSDLVPFISTDKIFTNGLIDDGITVQADEPWFDARYLRKLDGLISIGGIVKEDNFITLIPNIVWRINQEEFTYTTEYVYEVDFAAENYVRIDVIYGDDNGTISALMGEESIGVAYPPSIPPNTVAITYINVSDDTIDEPIPAEGVFFEDIQGNPYSNTALAAILDNVVFKTGNFRQTITKESEFIGGNLYINGEPENNDLDNTFVVMKRPGDGLVMRAYASLFAKASPSGSYIQASPSTPQNNFINISQGITTSEGKFVVQASGYTSWSNGVSPIFDIADGNGINVYGGRNFSLYSGTNQQFLRNNGNSIVFGNTTNAATFEVFGDGKINIPISPAISTSNYSLITRDETTGELKKVGSGDLSGIYQLKSEKGQPLGYASLDENGKITINQIPDTILGALKWGGTYNGTVIDASSVFPELEGQPLPDPTDYEGVFFVSTGSYTQGGVDYTTGDWIVGINGAWGKVDNTDAVTSVNGRIGAVTGLGELGLANTWTAVNSYSAQPVFNTGFKTINNPNYYVGSASVDFSVDNTFVDKIKVKAPNTYTGSYTQELQAASGTIALLSNIPSNITTNPSAFTANRIPFTTGAGTLADSGNLAYNNSTGVMTVLGQVSITSPTGTTSTTSAPGGASLAPISITGGQGGFGNNASGSSTGGNASQILIMGGQGGNASSSTTALAGKGADVIINAGDGGLTFGTATTKVAGGGGKAIMQGGSSTGGESGGVDIKGGNTSAIGGIGGRVRIFGGIGNNEAAGATDDSQYAGVVQLNISNNDAPRGRTLIAVKESDADFTNRLQVGGNARITGTVTAPTFVGNLTGNASSATNWGGRQADLSAFNPSLGGGILGVGTDGVVRQSSDSYIKSWLATSFQDVTGVGSTTDKIVYFTGSTVSTAPSTGTALNIRNNGVDVYNHTTGIGSSLILNSSGGNVGIGKTPTAKLDVDGAIVSNSGGFLSSGVNAAYNLLDRSNPALVWSMYSDANVLRIYNNALSADVFTISDGGNIKNRYAPQDNSLQLDVTSFTKPAIIPTNAAGTADKDLLISPYGGNVAIGGNFTPTEKLDVNGNIRARAEISSYNNAQTTFAYMNGGVGTEVPRLGAWKIGVGHANLGIAVDGGNVGVGTASPTAKLHVQASGQTALNVTGLNGYILIDNVGSGENYISGATSTSIQVNAVTKALIHSGGIDVSGSLKATDINSGVGTSSAGIAIGTQGATDAYIQARDGSVNRKMNLYASEFNFNAPIKVNGGDVEVIGGGGYIYTDTVLGTRHRVVLTNGVLTVSAAL